MSNLPSWIQELPQQERWKYSDFSYLQQHSFSIAPAAASQELSDVINAYQLTQPCILLVFINGHFAPALSDTGHLPKEVIACNLAMAIEKHADLLEKYISADASQHPFANLNASVHGDGLFLFVPDNYTLSMPIHLLSIAESSLSFISHPRHVIVSGKNSSLTLVEEYRALSQQAYLMNIVTHVFAADGAKMRRIKLQYESSHATHLAATFIQQQKDSLVDLIHYSNGARFARDDIMVTLAESGANCKTAGYYCLSNDNQYTDYHIDIHHAASMTESEMVFKGVADKKSRAVFNGRLHVAKDAQKIKAYQANHNILLSNQAEIYSKPELEIYADDVKCKHGATIGQLDQDALYYLRARGISEQEARAMLLVGFAEEVLTRIPEIIREHVMKSVMPAQAGIQAGDLYADE